MGILLNVLFFIFGFFIGSISRRIMKKIIDTKKMIKEAEEIVEREKQRKEFKEKFDIEID